MYTITKDYHFSASHILKHLPAGHPCARLHGHNYVVRIELQSHTLDASGFVVDYRELDTLKTYINDEIDHRHLNDILGDERVTAEHIAEHFYRWCKARWPNVSAVMVSETPRTWAAFRP